MSETSNSYRIRTNIGGDSYLSVNLEQDYDAFDILSLRINSADVYRLHNSNYGVVVGRVLANNGFGIPNAKISIFIPSDGLDSDEVEAIYPYTSIGRKDENGVRYNLLPDEKVSSCHQVVGTFPNKRYLLDNEDIIEVFDKYYKYTTRTNNSGDYIICGVPTGSQILHMDLDLSDCGILSQRPRDFVYKGYTVEQFENPNKFKGGTNYSNLSQIFSQDQSVYVYPFWGNDSLGDTIGITRADIDVAFKFEPTAVFMGCVASDNSSQGISKKCIPTPHMGDMDELVTGEGTIEMIRKTYANSVEEFQVKGTELINGDGIWCYQIPMNLDYMVTDEYGNMVPTDNPDKGIPTRARVRFRLSLHDMEYNTSNYFRPKVLIPHNPASKSGYGYEEYDYEFGTNTKDESFRDLFMNNVYTVKSYIPRFQKKKVAGWKEDKFSGIKHCQEYGKNSPIPYNNMRINMPFMFKVMCILIKVFIKVVSVVNTIISILGNVLANLGDSLSWFGHPFKFLYSYALSLKMNVIDEGLCPDLENWYFSPMVSNTLWEPSKKAPKGMKKYNLLRQTLESLSTDDDPYSIDDMNQDDEDEAKCITIDTDYLISCIEMNLAQEYKVVNFDFYNDWINGLIYIPRFMRFVRKKRKFLGITIAKQKVKGCMDDTHIFSKTRRYTQLCSLGYKKSTEAGHPAYTSVTTKLNNFAQIIKSNNLHKKRGLTQQKVFGKNGGICHEKETMYGQYVYYLKPCEWTLKTTPVSRKVNLFATDLVLLGSLNDCDMYGIPQAFKHLSSSSYIMPTNLALTNMEENGPLYAYGNNGMMCSQKNQTTENTDYNQLANPVRVIDGTESSTPLADELRFYSGASSNYDVEYDDPSDTIAMTEAAGISWNYTGPDQGKIDKKRLYYPGGHFLGLSCVNSQTNIKSCVNLERICELGSTMSQRREDVRAVKNVNGDAKLEYVYSVPTGFISGDDITDDEFRSMFATMNKNRLIATKINPETGYKTYNFVHNNPVNFSGELSKYTGNGTPYNTSALNVTDESGALSRYGIEAAETRDDYDPNEAVMTRTRTTEFSSIDYYMFRLGLSYEEINSSNSTKHLRQFAYSKNGTMYLPQYENSFYFYFGLHDGATALDEFNKQFFSECETSTLSSREPRVTTIVEEFNTCNSTSTVVMIAENMEGAITITVNGKLNAPADTNWYDIENGIKCVLEDEYDDIPPFFAGKGTYTVTVTDSEGTTVQNTFSVGMDSVEGVFTEYDFNVPIEEGAVYTRTSSNKNMFYGGYLRGEGASITGLSEQTDLSVVYVLEGKGPTSANILGRAEVTGGSFELYFDRTVPCDVYFEYRCEGILRHLYISTVDLMSTRDIDITMGNAIEVSIADKTARNWWTAHTGTNFTTVNETGWSITKSIVKETSSAETFSNNVKVKNGTKTLFGIPQNSEGRLNDGKLYCSDQPENIPDGYSLDDDASYLSTTHHYNAIGTNGDVCCGEFAATVSNQTGITKTVSVVVSGKLVAGDGCMFKPLPDGDLIPAIFESGNKITCLCSADEAAIYNTGIVYPRVEYPVIEKPFKVHANYFIVQTKGIDESTDMNGETTMIPIQKIIGTRCEARREGGITLNGNILTSSTMTLVEDATKVSMTGFSASTDEALEYRIVEWYPHAGEDDSYVYENDATTLELGLDGKFYDNVFFKRENGGLRFSFSGTSDSDIKYYATRLNSLSSVLEYEYWDRNPRKPKIQPINWWYKKNAYILGYYTDKAIYDATGQDVIVHLYDGAWDGKRIRATIPWTEAQEEDGVGTERLVYHTFKLDEWVMENMAEYIDELTELSGGRIKFRNNIIVKSGADTSTSNTLWTNAFDESRMVRLTPPNYFYLGNITDDNIIVVGVKDFNEGNATGKLFNIYAYPVEKTDMDKMIYALEVKINNKILPYTMEVDKTGVTYSGTIERSSTSSEVQITAPDWARVSNMQQVPSEPDSNALKYTFDITISENTGNRDRNGEVIFKTTDGGYEFTQALSVKQESGAWNYVTMELELNNSTIGTEIPNMVPIGIGSISNFERIDQIIIDKLPGIQIVNNNGTRFTGKVYVGAGVYEGEYGTELCSFTVDETTQYVQLIPTTTVANVLSDTISIYLMIETDIGFYGQGTTIRIGRKTFTYKYKNGD